MKKPEKKGKKPPYSINDTGYNLACDDWEKWLPSEEEINEIIFCHCSKVFNEDSETLVRAISKRIGKQ